MKLFLTVAAHIFTWCFVYAPAAQAKFTTICESGVAVPKDSKALKAPDKSASEIYSKVPDPNVYDHVDALGKVDYRIKNPKAHKICAGRMQAYGDWLACFNEQKHASFFGALTEYSGFLKLSKSLPIEFITPAGNTDAMSKLLEEKPESRKPIKLRVSGEELTIDLNNAGWAKDWDTATAKILSSCKKDCGQLEQFLLGFGAKVKWLEKAAALSELAESRAGIDGAKLSVCEDPTRSEGGAPVSGGPLTSNPKPKGLAKGAGKLDDTLKDCQNPELQPSAGGVSAIPCKELQKLGLESFVGELNTIVEGPGMAQNYIDLLRLQAVADLMKTHRQVTGEPLKGIPQSCERFKDGIKDAQAAPLTSDEKEAFERQSKPEFVAELQKAAREVKEQIEIQEEAARVPDFKMEYPSERIHVNPAYPPAQARLKAAQKKVRELLAANPLLAARDAKPKHDNDLPAVYSLASAKPEQVESILKDARKKISDAIAKNVAKACNASNDSGGWFSDSDSVSWIDLVRLKGLTDRVTKGYTDTKVSSTGVIEGEYHSPFAMFAGLQECLKKKADFIVSGREDAAIIVGLGCMAGTIMSGPFVGVPCAGVMLAMAKSNYTLASNRATWIRECQEQAVADKSLRALCSTDEYLEAREKYESAVHELILTGAFAAIEGGQAIFKGAKALNAARLAARARQIEEAGKDAAKLSQIATEINTELAQTDVVISSGKGYVDPKAPTQPIMLGEADTLPVISSSKTAPEPQMGAVKTFPEGAEPAAATKPSPSGAGPKTGLETPDAKDRVGARNTVISESLQGGQKAPEAATATSNGPQGLDRIELSYSEKHASVEVKAPAISVESPIEGAPKLKVAEASYVHHGKSAQQLAQESIGVQQDLNVMGKGGFQKVFANPKDATKVAKVFDRELLWSNIENGLLEQARAAKKQAADFLKAGKQAEAAYQASREKQIFGILDGYRKRIPPGSKVPTDIDKMMAAMIQRQRAYAPVVRNQVVPELQKKMGNIKVSMIEGLENVTEQGVTSAERMYVGPVKGGAKGERWVEATKYFKEVETVSGSAKHSKLLEVEKQWNDAVKPFNDRLRGNNQSFGQGLSKAGGSIEFDFGNAGDKMSNTYLRVDGAGNVLEVKISDI